MLTLTVCDDPTLEYVIGSLGSMASSFCTQGNVSLLFKTCSKWKAQWIFLQSNSKWLYTVAVSHDAHVDFFGSQEHTSGCSTQLDFSVPDSSDFISQALALQTVLQVKAWPFCMGQSNTICVCWAARDQYCWPSGCLCNASTLGQECSRVQCT